MLLSWLIFSYSITFIWLFRHDFYLYCIYLKPNIHISACICILRPAWHCRRLIADICLHSLQFWYCQKAAISIICHQFFWYAVMYASLIWWGTGTDIAPSLLDKKAFVMPRHWWCLLGWPLWHAFETRMPAHCRFRCSFRWRPITGDLFRHRILMIFRLLWFSPIALDFYRGHRLIAGQHRLLRSNYRHLNAAPRLLDAQRRRICLRRWRPRHASFILRESLLAREYLIIDTFRFNAFYLARQAPLISDEREQQ